MHYGYTIDPAIPLIFQEFKGRFTASEIIGCIQRLWADPVYSKSHNGIVDISRMIPGAGLDDLTPLVSFLKGNPRTSESRWAVITASPLATAGAMLYKRAMSGQHAFEIFSTWESACRYLQINLPRPPAPTFILSTEEAPAPPVT